MELYPPPPYPGLGAASPPVQDVKDKVYPDPPSYSATVVQPGIAFMQPELVVQPPTVIQTHPGVMVVNPVVVQPALTDIPASMICTYCQKQIITNTQPSNGLLVWTVFGVLLILGCWPCCLIPFCVNACKDVQHTCPNCRNVLHIYRRM